MADQLVLSASSISEYLSCRRRYMFSSVYRLGGVRNLSMILGVALHHAAEVFWKHPRRPETALKEKFAEELSQIPEPYDEPPATVLDDGVRMLGVFQSQVAPRFTPTMVEQSFLIAVEEVPGVLVAGTLDAADEKTDEVRDLKTVTMISKFRPESYATQLNLYGFGYRAMTGRPVKRLLLDVLTRRGQVPYREIEVPIDVSGTLDVLGVVRDAIMASDYSPTGADNGACKWCPYQEICSYAKVD